MLVTTIDALGPLLNRVITAQWEGMGDVPAARYEPALLPPCPTITVLCYSNCQRSTHSHSLMTQPKYIQANCIFVNLPGVLAFLFIYEPTYKRIHTASVAQCIARRRVPVYYTLHRVFAPRLCHSGQTHRFRHCSSAAAGALEHPKKNSRKCNKKDLYFFFFSLRCMHTHTYA